MVGGNSTAIGRLELCNTAGLRFGVCDDSWDDNDARVICRELGLLQEGVGMLCVLISCCEWYMRFTVNQDMCLVLML